MFTRANRGPIKKPLLICELSKNHGKHRQHENLIWFFSYSEKYSENNSDMTLNLIIPRNNGFVKKKYRILFKRIKNHMNNTQLNICIAINRFNGFRKTTKAMKP